MNSNIVRERHHAIFLQYKIENFMQKIYIYLEFGNPTYQKYILKNVLPVYFYTIPQLCEIKVTIANFQDKNSLRKEQRRCTK